jgi:5-methylcytosine-specific restriction protein A
MTARRMSTKRRAAIFAAHGGTCHLCGGKIDGSREAWEVEHVIALAISEDDSDDNLAPAHVKCHRAKTRADAKAIAKTKRVKAKHEGTYRQPRRKIPGSKGTGFKKRVDGIVERRTD